MSILTDLIISPLKSQRFKLHNLVTFDTETLRYDIDNGEFQKFFNFDAYDGKQHYYTEDLDEVYNIIYNIYAEKEKLSFFAHHIIFDLRTIHFIKLILQDKLFGLNNKLRLLDFIVYLKYISKDHSKVLQFSDSMNYFRTKLQNIAKMFDLSKENIEEYKLSASEWNKILNIDGEKRVKTDTEILYKAVKEFELSPHFDIGITLASTSFNTFRKRYLKRNIYLPENLIDTALNVYHGGIVMPYILAKEKKLNSYDINSLYPYVMYSEPYSIEFLRKRTDKKYIIEDIKSKAYNYLILVKYKHTDFQYSPVFKPYDNQLIPFLESEQWVTGNELATLFDNNFTFEIKEILEFKNDYIFKDFVNDYYNMRLQSKSEYEKYFFKIFLNSLYGKFGQHKGYSEIKLIKDIDDLMIQDILLNSKLSKEVINNKVYTIYEDFVSVRTEGNARYNPLIAGEITANARLLNFQYSKLIGFENLYYTDTDSFMTTKTMDTSKELGKLKLEKSGLFNIYAPKDYEFYGLCGKDDCIICHNKENGLHRTVKGVNDTESIIDNTYINKKWSNLKYKQNEDIYINYVKQVLQRNNKKMRYVNNIGYEWENTDVYNKANNISNLSFLNISAVII